MNRASILDAAKQAVTQDRQATHGQPENTFGAIAAVWSARLGMEITPAQVCILLVDLKTCRAWQNPAHSDSWVDVAGYAACGGELSHQDEPGPHQCKCGLTAPCMDPICYHPFMKPRDLTA